MKVSSQIQSTWSIDSVALSKQSKQDFIHAAAVGCRVCTIKLKAHLPRAQCY